MLGNLVKLHILKQSLADLCAGSSIKRYFDAQMSPQYRTEISNLSFNFHRISMLPRFILWH